jgi:two-component system sensor histidine kinase HydH
MKTHKIKEPHPGKVRAKSKVSLDVSSWIVMALVWVLFSTLTIFTGFIFGDRARLIRDKDNERILSSLFILRRNAADYGAAIKSNKLLSERIRGLGIYTNKYLPLYRWGDTPATLDQVISKKSDEEEQDKRWTIIDRKHQSVKFISYMGRGSIPPPLLQPPPPDREKIRPHGPQQRPAGPPFDPFFMGSYFYIDIAHPAYWRTRTIVRFFVPILLGIAMALALYMRHLYVRNHEYREKIEAQKNLVVLGTAASTLAHEIKNPLSAIRLQTGILAKLCPDKGSEEVAIINDEIERLANLTYRVNDYLREGKGNPSPVDVKGMLIETSERLCGRNILTSCAGERFVVMMDEDRLRSVLENLIRNALEAGGDEQYVETALERNGREVVIRVLDQGKGIAKEDIGRVFDPFFTKKSTGTGIGLAVSKRFTETAGGSIRIQNRENGGGAEVTVTLPEYEE